MFPIQKKIKSLFSSDNNLLNNEFKMTLQIQFCVFCSFGFLKENQGGNQEANNGALKYHKKLLDLSTPLGYKCVWKEYDKCIKPIHIIN